MLFRSVPFTMAPMRLGGTSRSRANLFVLIPNGFMKSSRRISPGWIGSSRFDGFIVISLGVLVVIHNLNVMRIAVTPGEADAPLAMDSNAIRPRPVAFQQFKLVSRGANSVTGYAISKPLCAHRTR